MIGHKVREGGQRGALGVAVIMVDGMQQVWAKEIGDIWIATDHAHGESSISVCWVQVICNTV